MIGVIGSGSWATGIAKILTESPSRKLNWWIRDKQVCTSLSTTGRNPKHLSNITLNAQRFIASTNLEEVIRQSRTLFLAVPSAFIAEVLDAVPRALFASKRIVSAIKGIVPQYEMTVSQYLTEVLHIPQQDVCVISGPTHAEEVALEQTTFITMASQNPQLAQEVERMMQCRYIHTSHSTDVLGVEFTGFMKNIYAIGAGMLDGLGYGDNLAAVYVTAAKRELDYTLDTFVPADGRRTDTPCILGDLMVTCWSAHSRNRTLGLRLAKGETAEAIFSSMGTVAEGYYAARKVYQYCETHNEPVPPIVATVYRVLYQQRPPREEMEAMIDNIL